MQNITKEQLEEALDFPSLIEALKEGFQADFTVPMRHHHDFENPLEGRESTLLLMPAWEAGNSVGVKIVTVSPNNGKYDLPAIQGTYLLIDGHKGGLKALMEAKTLTVRRTAAASAVASSFMSREDSSTLLMVGTGALAPNLIQAHAAARPIKNVLLWGRSKEKAVALQEQLAHTGLNFEVVEDIQTAVPRADIISCATLSMTPLIQGDWLQPGQHLDLVGAYRPDMREADDTCIQRARVFVDTYAGATKECGDIKIPLDTGILKREEIQADLFELCRGEKGGRETAEEITYFKSVGHALEDLAAARLAFGRINASVSEAVEGA